MTAVNPDLYEKSRACFDPTKLKYQTLDQEDGFTIVPMEDQQQLLSYSHQDSVAHDQPNCEFLLNLNYNTPNHYQQIQELQHHNNNNGCSFSVTREKVDNCISLFSAEKQRRQLLNEKYATLKSLVPISTKHDRASVVGDAINYIKVLHRTVNELQILVKKERHRREMLGMQKIEYKSVLEVERKIAMKHHGDADQAYNGSSWLQRKSKNTEVDVRIIDNEVTINLVHQKRINSLLFVSKVLDELHLDLQHVAGGLVGDFYNCMFNTKIYEGSSVYASAVANKIIDVVDKEYAASQPTTKC